MSRLAALAALALSLSLAAAGGAAAAPERPVVATGAGAVRGLVAGGMREFLGIPYAAPPVGALRWRPPQPHARWQGVRDATAYGSSCPQPPSIFGLASTDENCLFLNVFAPASATRAARLPVMVWIHGGALIDGESNDYQPDALVHHGVIVVTLNYRLGLLGFLADPALAAESPTHDSGDYGLLDQQAALRWVQRNIAAFGGDPRNVTIFGESAGGLSVRSQLVSPAAHGLFQHAIVESGAYAEEVPTLAAAEATGTTIAAGLGCSTAACLRALPVSKLLQAETATSQLPNLGSVLPAQYDAAFATGDFNRVPVLSGSNHDEWMLFVAALDPDVTTENYVGLIAATLGISASDAEKLAAVYPPGASPANALGALGTDAIFACNARRDVRSISQYVPAYQYEFADENAPLIFPLPVPYSLGAYHASELQYLFPTPAVRLDAAQQQLSAAMQGYWTNFAKTGDPNGGGLPAWPAYAAATDQAESLVPPSPAPTGGFAAEHKCFLWGG